MHDAGLHDRLDPPDQIHTPQFAPEPTLDGVIGVVASVIIGVTYSASPGLRSTGRTPAM